jgi:hypothetical protein
MTRYSGSQTFQNTQPIFTRLLASTHTARSSLHDEGASLPNLAA